MYTLDVRTALFIFDETKDNILLLKRSEDKALFPGGITGIGGNVELHDGEAQDIGASCLRELQEETHITHHDIGTLTLAGTTTNQRGNTTVVLYWFCTTTPNATSLNLETKEGTLFWHPRTNIAKLPDIIPTAKEALVHILSPSHNSPFTIT